MNQADINSNSNQAADRPGGIHVLFAGGGSGGHISPGLAIHERLLRIAPDARCRFICSRRAIDATMLSHAGVDFTAIPATPPSIKPAGAIRFLLNFRSSRRLVQRMIREESVTHVIALGGFIAAPVVAAAHRRGVPILMTNLDDPPGRANRWMAPRCTRVVSALALPGLPGFAERVIGMPIRSSAITDADPETCRTALGLEAHRPTLLITGASQGSTSINRFVLALARSAPEVFDDWQIFHLTGAGAEREMKDHYARCGVRATVEPFRHEMGPVWGAASLAISRAGASSVAEAAANAVPCLFMPYPYHQDRHQEHNARPLVEMEGAVLAIDHVDESINLQRHGPLLRELLADPDRLAAMKTRLQAHRPPDAAKTVAEMICGNFA